ncbi:MAG TPA: sialidase family protein [Candidatus Sulfopaludibacter sp.]|nr:sialidase family protein [Candidatus Sulfopaludibacter sp.]
MSPQQRAPGRTGTPAPVAVSRVSISDPWPASCNGTQTGIHYHNAPVEPFVAVDPTNPLHLIGVWQQDRWSDGGSSGLMAGVTTDLGRTWATSFARFSACSGGIYDRASDPWVSFSPDGTAYQIGLGLKDNNLTVAVMVSRSSDGGFTWGDPATLILDPSTSPSGSDKESITADPNDAHFVYAVWDRISNTSAPVWFSRTTDGGATWEPSRMIYDTGNNGFSIGCQIGVLPDGTLVNMFVLSRASGEQVVVARSTDHGATWSTPIAVSRDGTIGTVDVRNQRSIRTGAGIPAMAVDRASGAIYIVWTDGRFSGNQRDGIALSKSTDDGVTWSTPVQVNQATNVQAFTPAVAVGAGGAVAVTYYDFRKATSAPGPLLTNYWRATSVDGGSKWRETPLAGSFDMLSGPAVGNEPFLGDYQSIAPSGGAFVAFFVAANSGNTLNPSDVFASTLERPGDTSSTGRTEVNLRPHRMEIERRRVPPGRE